MRPMTIKERARLIRRATPACLAELFEMQNRICDLCGQPIQDLRCAALDHSTPVIRFARSDMPLEEAIQRASSPKNLRCAHYSCNEAKNALTREEWFTRGMNNREYPVPLTEGQLVELRFRRGAGGRAAGPIVGRRNVDSGLLARICSEGGRAAGPAAGRRAVESGQLARVSSKEARRRGGLITGRKNVESGHLDRIRNAGGRATALKHFRHQVTSLCNNILQEAS